MQLTAEPIVEVRLPLDAPAAAWIRAAYSNDENGNVRTSTDDAGHKVAVAGIIENEAYIVNLQGACKTVAKAARISDPHATLDWGYLANWLGQGIPFPIIRDAISDQVTRYGAYYKGTSTLRVFPWCRA